VFRLVSDLFSHMLFVYIVMNINMCISMCVFVEDCLSDLFSHVLFVCCVIRIRICRCMSICAFCRGLFVQTGVLTVVAMFIRFLRY
jgi:hypothetical protein